MDKIDQTVSPEIYYRRDLTETARKLSREEMESLHAAGDTDALTHAMLPMVMKIAGGYHTPGLDYMDLVQAGNLGLMQSLGSWKPGGLALTTWAHRYISREIGAEATRQRSRDLTILDDPNPIDDELSTWAEQLSDEDTPLGDQRVPSPDRAYEESQSVQQVRAAVADLPQRQREAVELVKLRGLTYAEAAHAMGNSVAAVHRLVQKGVKKL